MFKKIYYGWWIVFACATLQLYFGATFIYGFSALFNPIVDEFGWSYALVSLAYSFRGFESGALAPLIGIFVDKVGARKLLLIGVLIVGVAFLLTSRIYSLWNLYLTFIVMALGLSIASPVVTMTAVARWFPRNTTWAMGIMSCGYAAGGLFIPLLVILIDRLGWRGTGVLFGIGMFILGIPLALMVKEPPKETAADNTVTSKDIKIKGATVSEALRRRDFWLLSLAVFLGGIAGMALTAHQIPYMVSIGITRQTAGFLVSVLALSNVVGRLIFGRLGDKIDKRWCFAIACLLKGAGVLCIAVGSSVAQFIPSLIGLGLGMGGLVPLRGSLQLELFGRRAFGTIHGSILIFVTLGSIISPPFAGWMYDVISNYRPAFMILGIATLLAVPLIMVVSKKDKP